ncbi:hypothetical protein GGI21_004536, partial [Coemansia aciculifera]
MVATAGAVAKLEKSKKFVVRRETEAVTHLEPGLFSFGRQSEWSSQNRTLTVAVHPLGSKVALAVTSKQQEKECEKGGAVFAQDQAVHICGWPPEALDLRLTFISDTHAVFSGLQKIVSEGGP